MTDWTNSVLTGDCRERLRDLPESSVHAVVTDPPYGLAFMGRSWDDFEPKEYQEWCERWATAVKRVLKPGGHLLAFSGNRTHHRAFTGVEDAGFEIRDTVTWHYGSGFPKALDVSKAIDKRGSEPMTKEAGNELAKEIRKKRNEKGLTQEELGAWFPDHNYVHQNWERTDNGFRVPTEEDYNVLVNRLGIKDNWREMVRAEDERRLVSDEKTDRRGDGTTIGLGHSGKVWKATTDAAERWDGFKTALKPATEYVVVARKPLSEGTVAENVQTHGTGALNIDGCRVGTETRENPPVGTNNPDIYGDNTAGENAAETVEGRYPSNVVFDETEAERLDREVGELETGGGVRNSNEREKYGEYDGGETRSFPSNSGGPSRYFYTSKASKAERTLDGQIDNPHPTVKPTDLMEWLVTLVTAEGQIVLDPFAGSGTTLKAAKQTGRRFVGIERQPEYADIARVRAGLTPTDPANVREDDNQSGLEVFGE